MRSQDCKSDPDPTPTPTPIPIPIPTSNRHRSAARVAVRALVAAGMLAAPTAGGAVATGPFIAVAVGGTALEAQPIGRIERGDRRCLDLLRWAGRTMDVPVSRACAHPDSRRWRSGPSSPLVAALAAVLFAASTTGCNSTGDTGALLVEAAQACSVVCADHPRVDAISYRAGGGSPLLFVGKIEAGCTCASPER